MNNECTKWKDQLRDAALTGMATSGLDAHLLTCASCSAELTELRVRRERMDGLLLRVAQAAEPPAEFTARVIAATVAAGEAKTGQLWLKWGLAAAAAMMAAALTIGLAVHRRTVRESELATAQRLAEWRAPSDALLETPGQEILQTTPRLGEMYLNSPVNTEKGE
jgi:hypothetical protein